VPKRHEKQELAKSRYALALRLDAACFYRAADFKAAIEEKQMKYALVEGERREAQPGLSGARISIMTRANAQGPDTL
jgi:hypothetical protein